MGKDLPSSHLCGHLQAGKSDCASLGKYRVSVPTQMTRYRVMLGRVVYLTLAQYRLQARTVISQTYVLLD